MQDLRNKVVIVTSAGKGLGAATARAFAQAGSCVVCLDIDGEALESVCQDLLDNGFEGNPGNRCHSLARILRRLHKRPSKERIL